MEFKRFCLAWSAASLLLCFAVSLASAEELTIRGKSFYKDGQEWLPKGIDVEAFNEPATPRAKNAIATTMRNQWSPGELKAIRSEFGADLIRITVSQPGLDPKSPIFDAAYLEELKTGFNDARAAGFIVIASLDAQAENGLDHLPCMPDDSTVRAWQALGPALMHDQGIMFELFNEPCKGSQEKEQWAHGMQDSIDAVRAGGAKNILLLDGLNFARVTNGLFPLVHDSLRDRMALAIHPYAVKGWYDNAKHWHDQFGAAAEKYPTLATEWNATSGVDCIGKDTPEMSLAVLRYLESLHVGVVGWAIDSPSGKLVKDHSGFQPTDFSAFKDCGDKSDSGGGKLIANFPHD